MRWSGCIANEERLHHLTGITTIEHDTNREGRTHFSEQSFAKEDSPRIIGARS